MWIKTFILIGLLFGTSRAGSNDGKCEIDKFDESTWSVYLDVDSVYDDKNNLQVYKSTYKKKLSKPICICTSESCRDDYDYIIIDKTESEFVISTSDHMTDLDTDTPKTTNPYVKFVYNCDITCNTDTNSSLTVNIDIYDKNNHAPVFEETKYNYKVASPIMPLSDFSLFGKTIKVEDLDFSNTNMTFTIEPNDFDITSTEDPSNNKNYVANIKANKVLTITGPKTYKLTATDSGKIPGPLSTSVEVVIDIDESTSLDIPYFEYANSSITAYMFEYNKADNKLEPLTGSIKLNTNKPDIVKDVQLVGELKDYIEVKFDAKTKTFSLTSKPIENPTSPSSALILSLSTDAEASTTILIKFPNVPSSAVTFKERSYTGIYDDIANAIILNQNIEVIIASSDVPSFTITGDFSKNFQIVYDKNKKICSIDVTKALTPEQINSYSFLTLTLQATLGDDSDTSVAIIQIPTYTLEFTDVLYLATYFENNTVIVDEDKPIAFEAGGDNANVTIEEPYSKYFKISEELVLEVLSPLSSEILSSEAEISVVLKAKDIYGNQCQAVVKISLPLQESLEAPKFSELYYTVKYNSNDEFLDITEPLAFDNVKDSSTITIGLTEYAENFKLVFNKDKWQVQVSKKLAEEIMDNNNELIITMEATEVGSTAKGLGVLVVVIEKSGAPEFSKLSYLAKYTKGQAKDIDFGEPLAFNNVNDPTKITIGLDAYDKNFNVYYNKADKKWKIKIVKALDSDTFDKKSELVLTMTATEAGNTKTGKAVLVIELLDVNPEEGPKFSDISYIAQYTIGQSDDIEFTKDLSFDNIKDNTKIKIELDSYDENFNVYYNSDDKKWKIKIVKALDSDTFDKKSELVLTMIATEAGNTKTGQAVLVIELLDVNPEEGPKFSDISYIAQYTIGQSDDIEFTKELSFENIKDNTKIKIGLDSYDENFNVYYNKADKKWKIKIVKALDSDTFDKKSELVLTMIATEAGNTKTGQAVLVIELLDVNPEEGPKFSDISYIAQYNNGQSDDIEFIKELSFENIKDNTKIKIELDSYDENFNVYYNKADKKWKIKILKALDSDVFDKKSELVLTMTATEADSKKTGKAVLVIELLDVNPEEGPKFSDISYIAQYNNGQSDDIEFTKELSFENIKDNTKIKIELDSYDENFNVYYNKADKKWKIKIVKALDSDTFGKKSELVLTMTATEADSKKTGKAVLVIELLDDNPEEGPTFSDISYIAQYNNGQSDDIEFIKELSFENIKDNTKIKIELDSYDENFNVYYNSDDKKWKIKILKALDSDVFDKKSELVLTMTATEAGNTKTGKAVLVIELLDVNPEEGPKFLDLSYIAQYTNGQSDDIEFTKELIFNNIKDITKVTIKLDSYDENFNVYYNSNDKKWKIKIVKALDSDVFDKKSELVLTMTATEAGNTKTGKAVLVIELLDVNPEEGPKFLDLSYIAQYTNGQSDDIEFTKELIFNNIKDITKVTIKLDSYDENFNVYYNSNDKKWKIKIVKALDSDVFDKKSELVLTMTATEAGNTKTGKAVLVIELLDVNPEEGPKFLDLSYIAQYTNGQSDDIEFTKELIFNNIKDITKVTIKLDSYDENFNVYYNSNDKKWKIKIVKALDSDVFDKKSELVLTMTATEAGNTKTGKAVLVIELLDVNPEEGPKFLDLSYIAQYTNGQSDDIEFTKELIFNNIKDITKVTIKLDSYDENFNVYYNSNDKKWKIKIVKALDSDVFDKKSELVLTMTATEAGNTKTGKAVLVIELLDVNPEEGPKFLDLSYIAQYTNGQSDDIEFTKELIFNNIKDITKVTIKLDSYDENFNVYYNSNDKKWKIKIVKALDSDTFDKKSELVLTMTAIESGNTKSGKAVLVIELLNPNPEEELKFTDSYYVAQYDKDKETEYIDFDKPISFNNEDMSKIVINLDDYTQNFEVIYTQDKWQLHVLKPLDNAIAQDIILVLQATQTETKKIGKSVLVIELTNSSVDPAIPQFEKPFYTAVYPNDGKGTIPFDSDIFLLNVKDINKITITIPDYANNFNVLYNQTTKNWFIIIQEPLNDTVLSSNSYLTSILLAKIEGDAKHTPTAAFVLKLPDQSGPVFTKSYFKAKYTVEGTKAKVTLQDEIGFENNVDVNNIEIVSDEYSEYLTFVYDSKTEKWQVNTKGILTIKDTDKSDLVVAITATDTTTKFQGHSVIDLALPKVNTDDAPRFSKTYYEGKYDLSKDKATVVLDQPIEISNRDSLSTIAITTDKYTENFVVKYTKDKWEIIVEKNLDDDIINNNVDILMELIATDSKDGGKIGQSTLLIKLPNQIPPKFSSITYEAEYKPDTTILEISPDIQITNKEDLSKIQVDILEESYKSNFQVKYDSASKSWQVSVSSLPENVTNDLVLTLTATEEDNTNIGQAALVIQLPTLDSPKFSSEQFYGSYKKLDDISTFSIEDVKITNRDDQSHIKLSLSAADQDFSNKFKYSFEKKTQIWRITLQEPLDDAYLKGKSQLILTLLGIEDNNPHVGSATVIVSLPSDNPENDLSFSNIHYEGDYIIVPDEDEVQLKENIQLISSRDLSSVVFKFVVTDDLDPNEYFQISDLSSGNYEVLVVKSLPKDVLQNKRSVTVTLQATLGTSLSSTTLIINLPIPGEENTIDFSKLLYKGNYVTGKLTVEDISVITNEKSSDLKAEISKESPYATYFSVKMNEKTIELKAKDIPAEVLKQISVISLILTASSSGTTKSGSCVVNIDTKYHQNYLQFDSTLFNGRYEVTDGKADVIVDPITLTTDAEDNLISVTVDNAFADYFAASYSNSTVSLSLENKIPDENLINVTTLSLILTASIKNTDIKSQTVVNLRIITDSVPDTEGILKFNKILFTGQYFVKNGAGIFKQDEDIDLTTDRNEDEIDVEISKDSELEEFFTITYKNQRVTVSLKDGNIPDEDFHSRKLISLTMVATINSSSVSSSAVLNILINNDDVINDGYISFDHPVFFGNYKVEDDIQSIEYDKITVSTDQDDAKITASIEEPYTSYFELVYANKTINLGLVSETASSKLRKYTNLAVVVTVQIKNTGHIASTVVNFEVIDIDRGDQDNSPIDFPQPIFNGEYDVEDNDFTHDDIKLITQHPEEDIEVEIYNEYKYDTYFKVDYKNNEISIELTKELPKKEVKKLGNIALVIKARLKNYKTKYAQSVLNIKIKGDEDDTDSKGTECSNTKYIVAVSILSVLLFLIILGLVALYILRIRRKKYEKMTEDDYIQSKVKFDKSAMKRASTDRSRSSAIEERRPTGYVFTDPPNVNPREEDDERKKSVAFDENVEKLQIDQLNYEDIEKGPITEL